MPEGRLSAKELPDRGDGHDRQERHPGGHDQRSPGKVSGAATIVSTTGPI
jgi:hypothetical protein